MSTSWLVNPDGVTWGHDGDAFFEADRDGCTPPCCDDDVRFHPAPACTFGSNPCGEPTGPDTIYVLEGVQCGGVDLAGRVVTYDGWCYDVSASTIAASAVPAGAVRITEDADECYPNCADAGCAPPGAVVYERCGDETIYASGEEPPEFVTFCERDEILDACTTLGVPWDEDEGQVLCFTAGTDHASYQDADDTPLGLDRRGVAPSSIRYDSCCACEADTGSGSSPCGTTGKSKNSPVCVGVDCCEDSELPAGFTWTFVWNASHERDVRTYAYCSDEDLICQVFGNEDTEVWSGTLTFEQNSTTPGDFSLISSPGTRDWTNRQYVPQCGINCVAADSVFTSGSTTWSGGDSPGTNPATRGYRAAPYRPAASPDRANCVGPNSAQRSFSVEFPFPGGVARDVGSSYITWDCDSRSAGWELEFRRYEDPQVDGLGQVIWPGGNTEETDQTYSDFLSVNWESPECGCNPFEQVPVESLT